MKLQKIWTGRVVALILCSIVLSWSQPARQKIAVLGIKATSHASKSAVLTEKVLDELFKMDLFIVVEPSQVQEVMTNLGLAQNGCTQKMCAVEAGELLGAQKVIIGTVSGVNAKFKISLKMVDVQTGTIVKRNSHTVQGSFKSVLETGMMKATRGLIGSVFRQQDVVSQQSGSYAKKKTMRTVFGVLCAATSTGFCGAGLYYWTEKEKYSDLTSSAPTIPLKNKYEEDEKNATIAAGLLTGLSGAFLTSSIILFVVKPGSSENKKVSVDARIGPEISGLTVTFSF